MPAPYLESERLYYKAVSLENCTNEYVKWLNDDDVNFYLETGGDYTIQKLRQFLTEIENNKKILFWAIYIKESNKHIGNIKIDPIIKRHNRGEYGIMLGDKSEWGKGYAREATNTILDYCFNEKKLHKVTLGVVEDNATAVALYEKAGFVIEGKYIDHGIYGGKYCNVLRMSAFNKNSNNISGK
jgi:[ribosomal protein S5]-alanine N-acetyltransferase